MAKQFRSATDDERQQDFNRRTSRGLPYLNSSLEMFRPRSGDNAVRIVPPLSDDPHAGLWGLDYVEYYIGGQYFVSPKAFDPQANDPVNAYFFKLRQEDPDSAGQFRGRRRVLMHILDMVEDPPPLKLWPASPTLIESILQQSRSRKTGALEKVDDPEHGKVVYFTRTGEGLDTRYAGIQIDADPYPLSGDLADKIFHFKDILQVSSVEDLQAVVDAACGIDDDVPNGGGHVSAPPTQEEEETAPEKQSSVEDLQARVSERVKQLRNQGK